MHKVGQQIVQRQRILFGMFVRERTVEVTSTSDQLGYAGVPVMTSARTVKEAYECRITLVPQFVAYAVRADAQYGAMMLLMAVLAYRALFA